MNHEDEELNDWLPPTRREEDLARLCDEEAEAELANELNSGLPDGLAE